MFKPRINQKDIRAVTEALERGELSGRSDIIKRFEVAFAEYVGAKYAVSCNSGSSALFLALQTLRIYDGEVVCPAFGYIAAPNAIRQTGANPYFVDVEADTGNLNPNKVYSGLPKAIIAIDTYGHPCDYDLIKYNNPNTPIIEDAAEALGAEYKDQKLGGLPQVDMTCFSFFANKVITTGEGGIVTTNNAEYYKRLCSLRDQFTGDRKYYHEELGYSLCMSAMEAALGLSQLERIGEILAEKSSNAGVFNKLYGGWFRTKEYAKHSNWAFGMMVSDPKTYPDPFRPFFTPYPMQPGYESDQKFPNAERLHAHGVYLLT